ncbi:MAG: EAL domain-containing protein [Bacillus sp. (in: Bacteria)]|nr:EAL domain-containing protein [Bacillus sp. (in: firmicutes)]MCM1426825.1 EAL domain-containing protein [Eubacterium sp.]
MENSIYDYLTGLYNRKGLYEKFEEMSGRENIHFMFLDLDNFKTVNDVYGHKTGDDLLIATADIMQKCIPEAVVVRLGGDEFVLMIFGQKSREELTRAAEQILSEMGKKSQEMDFFTVVSMSIGIVWNAPYDTRLEQLLNESDAAMYEAKKNGKSCYLFYNDLKEKFLLEKEMEENAERALKEGRFQIRYQPVFHMQSSRLEQTQTRVIWNRDENIVWETADFRPVFERNSFVKALDLYIFETVCRDLRRFHDEGRAKTKISVQLSRLLFLDDNLGTRLQEIMSRYGTEAGEIELELSEKAFASGNTDKLIASMEKLKEQGFSLALIHFGEDFSSFRYLRRLPVDSLKFEETYIKENIQNNKGRQIIKTIIKLGKDLKLLLVAQGLVDKEEVIFLSSCGCDAAAGSFYAEQLPLEEYLDYTKNQIADKEYVRVFRFQNGFADENGDMTGEMQGTGVELTTGISDMWGGVYFPGGETEQNLLCYPGSLFSGNSYTLTLWIKPEESLEWTSVIYMRYLGGFASLVPYLGGGQSIYRISEDIDMNNGWHDTFSRTATLHKWCFIAVTYDSFSESICYYINGRKAGYRVDVPTMISCRQVLLGGDPFQKSYKGYVSALTIYDSVKTAEEVEQLYCSFFEEPGFCGERENFWMEVN